MFDFYAFQRGKHSVASLSVRPGTLSGK